MQGIVGLTKYFHLFFLFKEALLYLYSWSLETTISSFYRLVINSLSLVHTISVFNGHRNALWETTPKPTHFIYKAFTELMMYSFASYFRNNYSSLGWPLPLLGAPGSSWLVMASPARDSWCALFQGFYFLSHEVGHDLITKAEEQNEAWMYKPFVRSLFASHTLISR